MSISIKLLIPQTKNTTAIERYTSHILTENHVNIYIIQYGEIKKILFLKRIKLYSSNTSKTCFICAFGQPDGKLFVQKIWGTNSYFSPKMGPEVQATLSVILKM